MAKIIPLKMGADLKSPSLHEEETRVATLMATVEHYIPEFVRGVEELAAENDESSLMILHQDAFAANYDLDEYTLLGMAVKYAGCKGIELHIMGKNHQTF
jgi:hypothetical protein